MRLAVQLADDVLRRPSARLLGHGPQLGQDRPALVAGGDVRDVADGVGAGDSPARSGPGRRRCGRRDPGAGPAPSARPPRRTRHRPRPRCGSRCSLPSSNSTRSGWTAVTPTPSRTSAPALVSLLMGVAVRLVGELAEQGCPRSTRVIWPGVVQPSALVQRLHQLGQRAGGLDPGRPATDDDDVELARLRGAGRPWPPAAGPGGAGGGVRRRPPSTAGKRARRRRGPRRSSAGRPRPSPGASRAASARPRGSGCARRGRPRVTCAFTTVDRGWSLKMVRCGRAMSSAGSWELATW